MVGRRCGPRRQVSEEDVINLGHWNLIRDKVSEAAGAEVEEEPLTGAQFHHDAGAGLGDPRRPGLAAHEGDPHLVGAERFGGR